MKLYPLQFDPILKPKIWGGHTLYELLNKGNAQDVIGESWEVSAVPGSVSVVANGTLKGKDLNTLIEEFDAALIGSKNANLEKREFPLLFKFIDAKENLSLQVHPDDKLARKRHNSLGKTEMWYIMEADEGAGIYVGFKAGVGQAEYLEYLEKGKLQEIMNFVPVQSGDVFFIKAGLVHAIGEGVLLAEIQQSSDITYRVFDWNRTDAEGRSRELHTKEAIEAIDFEFEDYKIVYDRNLKDQMQSLIRGDYFHCQMLNLTSDYEVSYDDPSSFRVLMCVEGEVEIQNEGLSRILKRGDTILLPAVTKEIMVQTQGARLLQVTV